MKLKYHRENFNPAQLDPLNIDRLAVESIPNSSSVLEIGCADGFMGEYLIKNKGCTVTGIEKRKKEAKIARQRLTKIIIGDIENQKKFESMFKEMKNEKFDVLLATSVIEHLISPSKFLANFKKSLNKNGIIVITIPNVAHWSVRFSLFRGKFDYSEYGILDSTHLHFFTIKTAIKLLEENGFKIKALKIDSAGGGYPKICKFLGNFFPNIFAYQILMVGTQNSI